MNKLYNYCGNTRDFGMYKTQNGESIKKAKIIRSNLPNKDGEKLKHFLIKNHITSVIDLRTKEECIEEKSVFEGSDSFKVYHLNIPNGHIIPKTKKDVPVSYIEMLEAKDTIKEIFKILIEKEGIFYFCKAGKDRTGVISMLILMSLEVSDDTIKEDYVKTYDYIQELIKQIPDLEKYREIITPREDYMEKVLVLFKEKYGSIKKYLNLIGINNEDISKLKNKYIE